MSGPFNFITGIPAVNNNPSSDQPDMQTNFNSINNWVNVDHIGFNTSPTGGYHNVVHITQAPGNADPPLISTAGQLYTKTIAGNIQLFYESTSGVVSRLSPTGPNYSNNINGFTYLLGGLLLQWGQIPSPWPNASLPGTVTFPIAYSAAPYFVLFNIVSNSFSRTVGFPASTPPLATEFEYNLNSQSNIAGGIIYWVALGST